MVRIVEEASKSVNKSVKDDDIGEFEAASCVTLVFANVAESVFALFTDFEFCYLFCS